MRRERYLFIDALTCQTDDIQSHLTEPFHDVDARRFSLGDLGVPDVAQLFTLPICVCSQTVM